MLKMLTSKHTNRSIRSMNIGPKGATEKAKEFCQLAQNLYFLSPATIIMHILWWQNEIGEVNTFHIVYNILDQIYLSLVWSYCRKISRCQQEEIAWDALILKNHEQTYII